jgi:hypothetical protein
MTTPERVGGSGVKLTGVGTTVAAEGVGGSGVAEGLTRVGTLVAVEAGCDEVSWLTWGGGTVADAACVGNADIGDAGVVGGNTLAWEQATSPHSTSTAPTMTCPVFLILLPSYIAA